MSLNQVGSVRDKSTCAVKTRLTGLQPVLASHPLVFTITARDVQDNPRDVGGDVFDIDFNGDFKVRDNCDGTYEVVCAVTEECLLNVRLKGAHVCGSPYEVKLLTSATVVRMWGSYGGLPGQFRRPRCVAISGDEIFIADESNHRIQVFSSEGAFLRTWGIRGWAPEQFCFPQSLAVTEEEVFIIGEGRERVQVFNRKGDYLRSWGEKEFRCPSSLAVSNDKVFVADSGKMKVFRRDGTLVESWPLPGIQSLGLCSSRSGEVIFVADSRNHHVHVFSVDGTFLRKFGSEGTGHGQFNNPCSVATTASGKVLVVDQTNNRVHVFSEDGTFHRMWGCEGIGPGTFSHPRSVAVGRGGEIVVIDQDNHRVQVFNANVAD